MKRLIIAASALLLLASCTAFKYGVADYYPLKKDAAWTYRVTVYEHSAQGDSVVSTVRVVDEKDGTFLWQLIVPKLEGDVYLDWPSGGICSPPTVEGDRVYCLSNRGEVMCLDLNGQANGNDGPYKDEGQHMALKGQAAMDVTSIDADILWVYDLVSQGGIHPHDAARGPSRQRRQPPAPAAVGRRRPRGVHVLRGSVHRYMCVGSIRADHPDVPVVRLRFAELEEDPLPVGGVRGTRAVTGRHVQLGRDDRIGGRSPQPPSAIHLSAEDYAVAGRAPGRLHVRKAVVEHQMDVVEVSRDPS
jgi:hypothetical protein